MQTENSIHSNGNAEVLPATAEESLELKVYDFTAPTDTIPRIVENNGRKFLLSAILKKRTLSDLTERQNILSTEREAIAGGDEVERNHVERANSMLFRKIVIGGTVQEMDVEGAPEKPRTREQMMALTQEAQSIFISKLYRLKSEVIEITGGDEEDELSFMSETESGAPGEMVVRQLVGDPLAPDFEIIYRFSRPTQRQRDQFKDSGQVRRRRGGDKPRTAFVTDLKKAHSAALGMFLSIEGAKGSASEIDPLFLINAADAAVAWFMRDAENL